MKSNFIIRVVATNGKITKKILWVKRTARHICFGVDIPNLGHHTYHEDGKLHFKLNDKNILHRSQKIPLKDFRGRTQMCNFGFNKNLSILPHVDFDYKKVNGLVWIDARTLSDEPDSFNVDLQLIDAGRVDLAYRFPSNSKMHIFTFSDPWVVVTTT